MSILKSIQCPFLSDTTPKRSLPLCCWAVKKAKHFGVVKLALFFDLSLTLEEYQETICLSLVRVVKNLTPLKSLLFLRHNFSLAKSTSKHTIMPTYNTLTFTTWNLILINVENITRHTAVTAGINKKNAVKCNGPVLLLHNLLPHVY